MPGHARTALRDAAVSSPRSAGLPAVSLQPAAGAQGELTALLVAAAYFRDKGRRTARKVLVPDSAHGTNPASAALAGFETVTVKSNAKGLVDLDDLKAKLGDDTAVFMITNPNTLGLFETQITTITDLLHAAGGAGVPGRREHERHPRHHPAGRLRRGHAALQRPQDVHRPARRRRPRLRPDRRPRLPRPVPAGPVVVEGRRPLPPRLRPAEVDRPGAELLRQRRHPVPRLLLHPHARPGRAAGR